MRTFLLFTKYCKSFNNHNTAADREQDKYTRKSRQKGNAELIDYTFSRTGCLTNPIRTAAMIAAEMAMANGMAKEPVASLI